MADFVPQLVWMCTPDGSSIYFNRRWVDYTGLTLEQSYGKGWNTPFHPDDKQLAWDAWNRAVQSGGEHPYSVECRLRAADGSYRRFLVRGEPMSNSSGEIHRWFGTCTDVEGIKRESEGRFHSVLDNSRDVIYRLDMQTGRYEYISPSCETIVGYSPVEMMALDLDASLAMVHPGDRPAMQASLTRLNETGEESLVYRQRTKDGDYRWMSNRMSLIKDDAGRPRYRDGNIRDITERKQADEALRESEERYRNLFNSMNEGFCIIEMIFDSEGRPADYRFLKINAAFESQTGLHEAEGKLMRELAPDHEAHWFEIYGKIALTGEPAHFLNEAKALNRYYDVYAYRVGEPEKRQVAIVFNDISGPKRAEQAMRESEEEFRVLAHNLVSGVALINEHGEFSIANKSFLRTFDLDEHADILNINSRDWSQWRVFDENGRLLDVDEHPVRQALLTRTAVKDKLVAIQSPTCTESKWLLVSAEPILDAHGNVQRVICTYHDITQRKRAEEALLRSEKLASVGRMAATIAHEINNPLAAVTNLLYVAKSLNDPDAIRHYLEMADEELKRIGHITRQSLGFYRESNGPAPTRVNELLESAIDLLKNKIRAKQAVIEKQWDAEVEIVAVAGELRQVFSNLLSNSLDAIGKNGIIKVRVSTGTASNSHRSVRVTIADSGDGIGAASRQHIFEPFFTTKGTVGTGLGLWVSKQIVDKHAGSIRMRSRTIGSPTGTVFSIVLPVDALPVNVLPAVAASRT